MTEPQRPAPLPTQRETGLFLLVAPIAFVVVAFYNYLVAPGLCSLGAGDHLWVRILSFAVSAAGVVAGLWALYASYRNRTETDEAPHQPPANPRFLSVGGIMLSVLFIALTIIVGLSGLSFQPCQPV